MIRRRANVRSGHGTKPLAQQGRAAVVSNRRRTQDQWRSNSDARPAP
jgi:hypothetical protein